MKISYLMPRAAKLKEKEEIWVKCGPPPFASEAATRSWCAVPSPDDIGRPSNDVQGCSYEHAHTSHLLARGGLMSGITETRSFYLVSFIESTDDFVAALLSLLCCTTYFYCTNILGLIQKMQILMIASH